MSFHHQGKTLFFKLQCHSNAHLDIKFQNNRFERDEIFMIIHHGIPTFNTLPRNISFLGTVKKKPGALGA